VVNLRVANTKGTVDAGEVEPAARNLAGKGTCAPQSLLDLLITQQALSVSVSDKTLKCLPLQSKQFLWKRLGLQLAASGLY
jgi:hypothetical protein